eukprot:3002085-Prymnesium_polylepis.1
MRHDERVRPLRALAAGASVLLHIPGLRELLLLVGVRDANSATVDAAVTSGRSVVLNPGGVWEQVNTSHEREALYVQPSLGFIRLALRHGTPLLPMYGFGETQLWRTHGAFLKHRQWAAEHLRVGLPLVSGRLGTILPLALPYGHTLVVGKPID